MPTWVSAHVRGSRRRGAPPGLRADYKVSFLLGECLRISNKAAILSPFATDNEAAPRRWPLLVFCLLTSELVLRYTPSVLLLVFVVLLAVAFSPVAFLSISLFLSRGGPKLFRGTQIHPMRVRGVPASTRGGHGTCTVVDKSSDLREPDGTTVLVLSVLSKNHSYQISGITVFKYLRTLSLRFLNDSALVSHS